jgi:hypothetical protein
LLPEGSVANESDDKAMNGSQNPDNESQIPDDPVEAAVILWRRFFRYILNPSHANVITALATVAICFTGAVYTYYAGRQWQAAKDSAQAAKEAADTAARDLEVDQRPWVQADFKIDGPLTFESNGGEIPIVSTLRNSGRTPARVIYFNIAIFLSADRPNGPRARDQMCNDGMGAQADRVIFPQTASDTRRDQVGITRGSIDRNAAALPQFEGAFIDPQLIACILYRPTFASDTIYRSAYMFNIVRAHPIKFNYFPYYSLFKDGETVDADELVLQPNPVVPIDAR